MPPYIINRDYVRQVVDTYKDRRESLGEFPAPDAEVVFAAEILKRHLAVGNDSHAVELARVTCPGFRSVYVFANSGSPGALQVDLEEATRELRLMFGKHVSYYKADRDVTFYEPHHSDVDKYIQFVRPDFSPSSNPPTLVRAGDVARAVAEYKSIQHGSPAPIFATIRERALEDPADKKYSGLQQALTNRIGDSRVRIGKAGVIHTELSDQQILVRYEMARRITAKRILAEKDQPENNETRKLSAVFAGAVAMRLRMVETAEYTGVRTALNGCISHLRLWQHSSPHLGIVADALAMIMNNGGPITPCPSMAVAAIKAVVDRAVEILKQSRFCAEPRVFAAISREEELCNGVLISLV